MKVRSIQWGNDIPLNLENFGGTNGNWSQFYIQYDLDISLTLLF